MGNVGGFLDAKRKNAKYRDKETRIKDYRAVEIPLPVEDIRIQASRCMDCGVPFCHCCGCPISNFIPEFNDHVYHSRWKDATDILLSTSCFPEFTARICPAPCEASCVLGINDDPVNIRQIELAIIEKGFQEGYIRPRPPAERCGKKVAVIGSGPAGLSVADVLNRAGFLVTAFDENTRAGGILTYGIPDFKLEKHIVQRRIDLMTAEGVTFELGTIAGEDISYNFLKHRYDAICLAGGARNPRDLNIPGRMLKGIHFAMDFLVQQNKRIAKEPIGEEDILATGKNVVVIGGGDTGSDCLGTSIRQKADYVSQFEIMPKPPSERAENTPWPTWPNILRESSSHKEGGERHWSVSTLRFKGDDGNLSSIECVNVSMEKDENGRLSFVPKPGTEFEIKADMALLALGFTGPADIRLTRELEINTDQRDNIKVDENHMTNIEGLFAAGDMAHGQSLVVRAMADGKAAAESIIRHLT